MLTSNLVKELMDSTCCYCNCSHTFLFRWMDDAMIAALTPVLIGKNPNTYTFTKSLAEYIITRDAKDLPVAIFRPSIIGAAMREPCPVSGSLLGSLLNFRIVILKYLCIETCGISILIIDRKSVV